MTVLRDSIHIGSMSPSRTIHFGPSPDMLARSLMITENKPEGKEVQGSGDKSKSWRFGCTGLNITRFG